MRKDTLESLGFNVTHEIVLREDALTFSKIGHSKLPTIPSVYVWAATSHDSLDLDILYVGKAGKGIELRCNQHAAGFKNSGTGRKNASALREILQHADKKVLVFGRAADVTTIFGHRVSLYSSEEDAACRMLNPRLNRAAFPEIGIETLATDEGLAAATASEVVAHDATPAMSLPRLINARFIAHEPGALDDLYARLESYDSANLLRVGELLNYAEANLLDQSHSSKLVESYTDLPPGCNGETVLTYGQLGPTGRMLPLTWVYRIVLADQPRVVLPIEFLADGVEAEIARGKSSFSPNSTADFLSEPSRFVARNRRPV